MAGWVGKIGGLLLVAGCAGWGVGGRARGARRRDGGRRHHWHVELELYVIDLRLAPLLLAVAGVGLLVAPTTRSFGTGAAVVLCAAFAAEVVTAALDFGSVAPVVTASALLVVLLGVALTARRWSKPDEAVARRLTTALGVVLLCSPLPMQVYVAFDASVLDALPGGYVAVVRVLQGLMLAAGTSCVLLGATRLTWLHVAAVVVVVAMGLLFAAPAVSFDWMETGAVCVAVAVLTASIVAGAREQSAPWSRSRPSSRVCPTRWSSRCPP